MQSQMKLKNYIHLSIQSICFFLVIKFLTTILHEMGHCLGGWLAGLKPVGIYAAVLGGGMSYFTGPRITWQNFIMSASGPAVDIISGLIILLVVFPRVKKWTFRLFWLFYTGIAIFMFWGYMVIGGFLNSGDFANLSRMLDIAPYLFGFVGLTGLVVFAYLIGRHILQTFLPYFSLDTYWKKFLVFFFFIGLPGIIYVAGGHLVSPGGSLNQIILMASLAVFIPCLFSFISFKSESSFQIITTWPTYISMMLLSIAIMIWLFVFGLTEERAKGFLWTVPDEERVGACNITVAIDDDMNAKIDLLMRPSSRHLFWNKMRHRPPNWPVYTRFIDTNIPILLGNSHYRIIGKFDDRTSPFFMKKYDKGARRVILEVRLDTIVQAIAKNTYALEIIDFWRVKGGYLERVEVFLHEGMRFANYALTPDDAKKPDLYNESQIVWENESSYAPEKVRLFFIQQ